MWEKLDIEQARAIARKVLTPFVNGEVDAIYLVYNEFKSAMSQRVVTEPLFPLQKPEEPKENTNEPEWAQHREYLFEPNRKALMERLEAMTPAFSGARLSLQDALTAVRLNIEAKQ